MLGQQYLKHWITFEDASLKVLSIAGSGALPKLKLSKASAAKKITYVPATGYPRVNNATLRFAGSLIFNKPGTGPALTFLDYPIAGQFSPVTGPAPTRDIHSARKVRVRRSAEGWEMRFAPGSPEAVAVKPADARGRPIHQGAVRAPAASASASSRPGFIS